ncbi:MAG: ATP-binding cassette domain-containing protein [Acidimicrobiaceae bacterium]|nr:ATP-binding cassette domain-containing protein [Acidimicrobiaceae bacterium]
MTASPAASTALDSSAPAQARLACVGVTVRFGGLTAVNDVSLAVPPDAIVGLVGPNGAGKTTLFGVLSGLLRPARGKVLLGGEDVTGRGPQLRAARGLARTFQHPELFTGLSVRDHLVLAYRAKHAKRRVWLDMFTMGSIRPPEQAEGAAVDELIEMLGLQTVAGVPALGLPLGTARLVELGRALATSPTVLLLDEPSAGLDSTETEEFERTLRRVTTEHGTSVLLVEHDVELVMRACSAVSVLDFGMQIASGTPAQIQANPAVRAAYLGEEVDRGGDAASIQNTGAVVAATSEPAADGGSAVAVAVEDLGVRYGDAVGLSGVSFSIGDGKALAVLGANGAGKSSLARVLSGLVPAASGRIVFAGEEINRWPAYRIRRSGLLHLPEGRGVFPDLTVIDNLRMAAGAIGGRRARRQAIEQALEIFEPLADRRNQVAGSLSGGEQQMLSLARALATSPRVLIADEMSLGLAPMLVDLVFDGLATARQAGVTVIMIEQYVHRALAFADECLVLQRGCVAWTGPTSEARNEVLSHYLGEAVAASGPHGQGEDSSSG